MPTTCDRRRRHRRSARRGGASRSAGRPQVEDPGGPLRALPAGTGRRRKHGPGQRRPRTGRGGPASSGLPLSLAPSSAPAARPSPTSGPPTTSAGTQPAPSASTTESSATSRSTTRAWSSPPTLARPSSPSPPPRTQRLGERSPSSPAGPPHRTTCRPATGPTKGAHREVDEADRRPRSIRTQHRRNAHHPARPELPGDTIGRSRHPVSIDIPSRPRRRGQHAWPHPLRASRPSSQRSRGHERDDTRASRRL